MSENKFCIVPWKELYSTSIGTYRMCCLEQDGDQFKNNQTPIDQGIEAHWNSDYMKQSRLMFLENKEHPACNHCWSDEKNGHLSLRKRLNQGYHNINNDQDLNKAIEHFKKVTSDDGSIAPDMISAVNLSVGNTCQLRCSHCNPAYSNSVAKDYQRLGWDENFKTRKIIIDDKYIGSHKQSVYDLDLWPEIEKVSQNLTSIKCTGGEPTISKGLLSYMKWLCDQKLSKNISFSFNTNAMTLKEEFLDLLKQFANVTIRVSIDGTPDVDHYIRYPSDWNRKMHNLQRMRNEFKNVSVQSWIYSLNLLNLPDLIDEIKSIGITHDICTLHYPDDLDIRHVPDSLKQIMIDVLNNKHQTLLDPIQRQGCMSIINRLQLPGSHEAWKRAIEIIKSYDSIRPYTLASALPLLAPYLK